MTHGTYDTCPARGLMDIQLSSEFVQGVCNGCQHLVALASWLSDSGDAEGYARCYTPNGVFDRGGDVISGHEALARFVAARPREMFVRHFNSLPLITVSSPDSASGVIFCTIMRREAAGPASTVRVEIHDEYRLTAGGWLIARRVARAIPDDNRGG